jgi:hypothetical protein
MKKIRVLQSGGFIRESFFIHQERKIDAGIFPKHPRIIAIAEPDGGERGSLLLEVCFLFAQLRDVLTAENSAVVAEEHDHGGPLFPQGAEAHQFSVGIRQGDVRQSVAEGLRHDTKYTDPVLDVTTPLMYVKGVGPARAAMLEAKGLKIVEDLLFYAPFRYEDRSNVKTIRELAPG